MGTLLRKLRGLAGIGLTGGIVWAAIIAVIGMIIGFGILLSLTETGKTILELSLIRVAIWGSLASAALPFLTGMPIGMMWFVCLLAATSASASVAIARRAELHAWEQPRLMNSEPRSM